MDNCIIKVDDVDFVYKARNDDEAGVKALSGARIEIPKGQFVVVIGRNGSGKSTFARLLNALLLPTRGFIHVKGFNTSDSTHLWEIRSSAGMVFQNPDNQIIGTTVEEDVAFGPENLGIPPPEIRRRVDDSLKTTGMYECRKNAPHMLSGGQKQKVAIAGILAMKPECIILDEATSMLDPAGRKEVMQVLKKLNREEGITVIHITHHMDEVNAADRVVVMEDGSIVLDGKPGQVFSDVERIRSYGLDVPQVTELFHELNRNRCNLPLDVLDVEKAYECLVKLLKTC